MSDQLNSMRQRIDEIDEAIQQLISERATIAQQVAITKQKQKDTLFYRAEREAEVLKMVIDRNEGPLDNEEIARLFREIMSACLALEQPMIIAFLGPEGTFTQTAALKHFGHSVQTSAKATIADVFREVESGSVPYGVVPVENSTEGVINHTLDLFLTSSLYISGEVELRIHHHLLQKKNTTNNISKITKIYSHSQSLAQCREWLEANLNGVEQISVNSNAEAAKIVAESDDSCVAIAGDSAASLYDLYPMSKNIEDQPNNTTRFLVIGKNEVQAGSNDKTTILVSTKNRAGALHKLLEPIARNGLSLSRIESRPSRRGMWDYVFFIDIDGHKTNQYVAAALKELTDESQIVKVLGSYPKAVL